MSEAKVETVVNPGVGEWETRPKHRGIEINEEVCVVGVKSIDVWSTMVSSVLNSAVKPDFPDTGKSGSS